MAVALRSLLRHHKHCTCIYQVELPSSRLRYLNKAVGSQKCNWQRARTELAPCTARVEGRRAGPRALPRAIRHYARPKYYWNLIPRQISFPVLKILKLRIPSVSLPTTQDAWVSYHRGKYAAAQPSCRA